MKNSGIIRNQRKIVSVIHNARAYLKLLDRGQSLSHYLWEFVGGEPIMHSYRTLKAIPAETRESKILSQDLKQHGFQFVGPTICYAFMQAVGMVNDHLISCFRYPEIRSESKPRSKRLI